MATYTLGPNVKRQYLDNSGNPLAAGLLYTYLAGSLTAATTYQTSSGTAHANPIVLDSAGRISGSSELYLQPGISYKFILQTSAAVQVWAQDNIAAVPPSTINVDVEGRAGTALAAEDVVYLSTGSGSLNAGQWYKADADLGYSSSDAHTVGMVPSAIASGATGTIRIGGEMTVTGPLTPGAPYYVSATAGALTATAPSMTRYVGQSQTATSIVIVPNPVAGGMDLLQIEALLG